MTHHPAQTNRRPAKRSGRCVRTWRTRPGMVLRQLHRKNEGERERRTQRCMADYLQPHSAFKDAVEGWKAVVLHVHCSIEVSFLYLSDIPLSHGSSHCRAGGDGVLDSITKTHMLLLRRLPRAETGVEQITCRMRSCPKLDTMNAHGKWFLNLERIDCANELGNHMVHRLARTFQKGEKGQSMATWARC